MGKELDESLEKGLTSIFDHLLQGAEKEQIELYKSLYGGKDIAKSCKDFNTFHHTFVYPHTKFLKGLLKSEVSKNDDVVFLFLNSRMIEQSFLFWIERIEGSASCADKSTTIVRRLIDFYANGTKIEWDYEQEYTFHLPKKVFTTHDGIVSFYQAIRFLSITGNPKKYLEVIQELTKLSL